MSLADLVSGQEAKGPRGVGDHVALGARVETRRGVSEPVQPDAEDAEVLEAGDKQLLVCSAIAELLAGAVKYRDLAHPAPVPRSSQDE